MERQQESLRREQQAACLFPERVKEICLKSLYWVNRKKNKKQRNKTKLCHSSSLWKTSLPPIDRHTQNQNTHFAHNVSRFNESNTFTGIASLENQWGIVYFSGLHFFFRSCFPKVPQCSKQEDVRWKENKEYVGEIESNILHYTWDTA